MMGRLEAQEQLFYRFRIEDHIPQDHLLRRVDRFLDFSALHQELSSLYSHTGRPSIDPELMIRMLLVGYCFAIRSERRLCQEVHLYLAYRWFCRLDLTDHSTFSKNRSSRQIAAQSPAGQCMAVSARAICCATCSRRPLRVAWRKGLLVVRASPWMPA